jgi:hypothetical protein
MYTVMLLDLKKIQKDSTQQEDGFKEVQRRKSHCQEEPNQTKPNQTMKKVALPASTVKVATKNFFAPLRTNDLDTDAPDTEKPFSADLQTPFYTKLCSEY